MAAPSGVVLGLLCGASAAVTVRLVFGSSGGRPSLAEVRKGLVDLGVPVGSLCEASSQEAGVFLLDATHADGRPLLVKSTGVTPGTLNSWLKPGGHCGFAAPPASP